MPARRRSSRAKFRNDPRGRKTIMRKCVLNRLERAFREGKADCYAARFAQVSPRTMYYFQKDHPSFLLLKKQLKQQIKIEKHEKLLRMLNMVQCLLDETHSKTGS